MRWWTWTFLLFAACKPEPPVNPYAVSEDPPGTVVLPDDGFPSPDQGSFTWLHEKVFSPTCANAGCHDGTFEPDFRTVGSSYNSLVYHPVISNDASGSFAYRVLPSEPAGSLLLKRLLESIPNTSGMMPLEVDEGSDWPQERENYLAAIDSWISAGAPDAAGNFPVAAGDVNLPPIVAGFSGFPLGNFDAPYGRDPEMGYALVVEAGVIDLWFAFEDDATAAPDFQAALRVAGTPGGFAAADPVALEVATTGFEAPVFFGGTGTYRQHTTLDLTDLGGDTILYLQVELSDGELSVVAPAASSPAYMTNLFSLVIL